MKRLFTLLCAVIVILGALNMGIWGLFQIDIIAWLSDGNSTMTARIIYIVIGLTALYLLFNLFNRRCIKCGKSFDECKCNKS